jgi:hypothetical protein
VGGRSWKVGRLARRARGALERVAGVDVAKHPRLSAALDAAMALVLAPKKKRLPLDDALSLLWLTDAATFARTVRAWRARVLDGPAASSIGVLATTIDGVPDPEVAIWVARVLVNRDLPRDAWRRWFDKLRPFLDEALATKGKAVDEFVGSLKVGGDEALRARVGEARS